MSKKELPKVTIDQLLEKEKTKNRRIITAVVFATGILIGLVGGYFQAVNVVTDTQAKIVNSIEVSVKENQ